MCQTRICKRCQRELSVDMFDEGRHQCRDCRKLYRKQHRKEHPEIHIQQALRRQKRRGDWLNQQKTSCIICGESEACCIDFHHKTPEQKNFTIGKKRSLNIETLQEEINKCVCLCANCHRKVHAGLIDLSQYEIH